MLRPYFTPHDEFPRAECYDIIVLLPALRMAVFGDLREVDNRNQRMIGLDSDDAVELLRCFAMYDSVFVLHSAKVM
ncbi:hypothetical protein BACDOR_01485 [Phocaeicola dorei DSM 17855]|uniref:Uncharacterized protein n=1 Tax=Phocaeicola dorei DSM 17855 TaxID=483217 RepID=B6VVZ3_9BACT|nr:hypothetical protein BACDOR_01485 [Phocaeicola dorei DSM 17855]